MNINEVKPVETKDLDITRFWKKQDKKKIIQLKHFTVYQRKQMVGTLAKGQRASVKDGKAEVKNIEIGDTDFLAEVFLQEMEYGVVKETCPFDRWDKAYIEELDIWNEELIAFIYNAIQELNPPLAMVKETK